MMNRAVVVVGHGAPPSDAPPEWVPQLKRLESARRKRGGGPVDREEVDLDARLRAWPRTLENDPYHAGVERLATAVRAALPDLHVVVAYNEFCGPTLEEAVRELARKGVREVCVVPTMLTRGGVHSEIEIPEAIANVARDLDGITIRYAWPFDEAEVAALLVRVANAAFEH